MPSRYAEPPDWLQFNDGGHWLVHGNTDSRQALREAPTDSQAYADAKAMRARKWKASPLGYGAAMQGWEAGRAIAVVPASVGILILDVDQAEWAIAADLADELGDHLNAPIWFTATRKGYHIVLPTDLMLGNGTFTTCGGASGDIRSVDGYVVVHGDEYLDAIAAASRYPLPSGAVHDALQEVFNWEARGVVEHSPQPSATMDGAAAGAVDYVPRFPQPDPNRSPEEQLADRYIELGLIPDGKRPSTREEAMAVVNELLVDA